MGLTSKYLYAALSVYCLITTLKVKVKFNEESTGENKYVDLTLDINVNNIETLVNY